MTSPSADIVRIFSLIPCGGVGSRAGEGLPKQYRPIAGRPMVAHTLQAFAQVDAIAQTLLVIAPDDAMAETLSAWPFATLSIANCAGSTRAETVLNGLNALLAQGAQPRDWVLVHDAARCLITPEQIRSVIAACQDDAVGGLMALPLPDTLKQENQGRVGATVDRAGKWLAQTPQMFRIGVLISALQQAVGAVTDEASAIERAGLAPKLVRGSAQNFKVTYPEDFALAEALLQARMRRA
jgi:2-C-methyl-D-erythritol 4-phosphate cytidylyltransferase